MEIALVRNLLQEVALDHSKDKPEKALQNIALALMHIAESVHKLEGDVRDLNK